MGDQSSLAEKNRLYYGDCLTVMRNMLKKPGPQSVDLIYLDPPFNSNRSYNMIYKDETGRPLPDQVEAFCDIWEWGDEGEKVLHDLPVVMEKNGIDSNAAAFLESFLQGLRNTDEKLLAYLCYMTERLVVMWRLLKPTGSLYLHCDPTASHYIKVVMDALFGHKNFRNEIVWSYRRWPAKQKNFQRMHDIILRYTKGDNPTWNQLYEPLAESTLKADGGKKILNVFDASGKRMRGLKTGEASPGAPMRDVWNISVIAPTAKERTGYATQKPLALLDRIIRASSNEGDLVLDPFCGCATTIVAAHKLGRRWIGIDIAFHAIKRVAKRRLEGKPEGELKKQIEGKLKGRIKRQSEGKLKEQLKEQLEKKLEEQLEKKLKEQLNLKEGEDFTITGIPRIWDAARDLWKRDTYHFQKWAVEEVEGFVTTRKTGDKGIDGRIYFDLPPKKGLASMILEVKGGENVGISTVRDLRGVLERARAEMAGLILLRPLGDQKLRNFKKEMADAGSLESPNNIRSYPRMQILTIAEILDGKRFDLPTAPRGQRANLLQPILFQSPGE